MNNQFDRIFFAGSLYSSQQPVITYIGDMYLANVFFSKRLYQLPNIGIFFFCFNINNLNLFLFQPAFIKLHGSPVQHQLLLMKIHLVKEQSFFNQVNGIRI